MARLTLPHPNKDFVPLSPLTAQDLDEMVANTKAVADFTNGLASGKNIDDGSIEPSKLKGIPMKIVKIPTQLKPFSEESFSSFNGIAKDQYVSVVKTGDYVPDARKYMWFVTSDSNWQVMHKIVSTHADGLVIRTWRIEGLGSSASLGLGSHRPNIQIIGMKIED
nr:MAG TPA: hypothetical protein [Caudoviricetes sp.]